MPTQRASTTPPPAPPHPPGAASTPHEPQPRSRRPPWRFGMRTLLIVVTVVALASPLMPNYGRPIADLLVGMLTLVVVPVCLLTAAVYSRGMRQTFFLGAALASLVWVLSAASGQLRGASAGLWLFSSLVWLLMCALSGGLAVATRRFIQRRGWDHPDDSTPRS
jgi:4-hydroxybenzoate polyprenyltransferase